MDKKTQEQITSFTTAYKNLIDNANQPNNTIKDYFGYSHRWRYKNKDGKYSREDIDRIIDSGDINSKIALPATGGPGNKASLIIGVVILTTSLLTFAYYFHARRRREEGS